MPDICGTRHDTEISRPIPNGEGHGADAEGGEVQPEILGDVRWRQNRGYRRRLFAVPDNGDSPTRAPCLADEKTYEGGEPERRGKGVELEGDLAEAAPSSSSLAAGDDDDDPFLLAVFVSVFSDFSRERERVEGRGRQRGVRRHERLCVVAVAADSAGVSGGGGSG
uniref:DUF834 domain-containing protein n=1 Tax=Oryza meridionalis TaxID=40149 RepID=A0A0E0F8A3_9ORYZ